MSAAAQHRVPRALTIAGSDSGGGAGIQADLKTFAALQVYGSSAIVALTAQNTLGVTVVHEAPPDFVAAQLDAVLSDIGADAAKTGMLGNAAIVRVVAAKLREYGVGNLVVDPVMVAKSGDRLLREEAVAALIDDLLPLARVVTPNLPEAEVLVGRRLPHDAALRTAAEELVGRGAASVVIKGGHRPGPEAVDLFYDGRRFHELRAPRIDTRNTHGTGCTFAAAIAAYLARGAEPLEAVSEAKRYLHAAIAAAYDVGAGHGPVHHFYHWWQPLSPA